MFQLGNHIFYLVLVIIQDNDEAFINIIISLLPTIVTLVCIYDDEFNTHYIHSIVYTKGKPLDY